MAMTLNEYQQLSTRTIPASTPSGMANYALGLVCESGEVGDHIKKHVYHGHPINLEGVLDELGDVLHYLSGLAYMAGHSLDDVATFNLSKLSKRYPKGFSQEASLNREY